MSQGTLPHTIAVRPTEQNSARDQQTGMHLAFSFVLVLTVLGNVLLIAPYWTPFGLP